MNNEAFFTACKAGNVDKIQNMLNRFVFFRPNVNAKDKDGFTGLMYCAIFGHLELCKLLISKGAKIHSGNELILFASGRGHYNIVNYFIENGANVNGCDECGHTPLQEAALCGCLKTISLLISKGADVNAKAKHDYFALWLASSRGHAEAVKLLIEKGADVNAVTEFGGTALMQACENNHIETVMLLLEKGADINAKQYGETAVVKALLKGNSDIVELLNSREFTSNKNIEKDISVITCFCQACGSTNGTIKDIAGCKYAFCSKGCENSFGSSLTMLDAGRTSSYESYCRHCGKKNMAYKVSPKEMICKSCGKGNT